MISKTNDSTIKEILYPDINKKPLKNFLPKNHQQLRLYKKKIVLKKNNKKKRN